jgi:ribosomal protein S18 acetylase RimI-like enzyme
MRTLLQIIEIAPVGERYEESRRVRGKVLREPLGMGSVVEIFPFEAESWHFLAIVDKRVVGCALFHPRGQEGRLFQMAVLAEFQGQGIGRALVTFLEDTARRRNLETVFLHSRDYAVPFYRRCGYGLVGDPFMEIGIPHQGMAKPLREKK